MLNVVMRFFEVKTPVQFVSAKMVTPVILTARSVARLFPQWIILKLAEALLERLPEVAR